ncbi:MAG: apolipoprotein N-acyltransferase [Pseudomonadales bacterium]|nr:apolipoprotein N-acyltransferase [Pseudomonadales bacterium]
MLALIAGALLPLAFAPFDLWPLGILSVGLWFHLLERDPGRGLLLGWLYGAGKYGVGVSWVYVSIHEHGGAPPLLAGLLVVLFVSGLSLFTLANGWLFIRWRGVRTARSGSTAVSEHQGRNALKFLLCFVLFEWLLTWVLTGFPWLLLGYGFPDTTLRGFAPLGGVFLVSGVAAAVAVALTLLARGIAAGRWRRMGAFDGQAAALLLVILLPWLIGAGLTQIRWSTPQAAHRVALVQGNVPQTVKWQPETRAPIIEKYLRLSEPYWGADLILWPEAALTAFEHEIPDLLARLNARGQRTGTALVLGIPGLEVRPGDEVVFHNTTLGLGMASGRYVKRRLVPFGEYVPLEDLLRGLITFFDLPMSRAEPGNWRQPLLQIHGAPAAMAICYEVVYPELLRESADVLLTVSNDTWFGDSLGPRQHLQMARMRALENGRWLLRATNDGLTAIIDPRGRIDAVLPRFEEGVLVGGYRSMQGRTPYNRLGNWPLLGTLAFVALLLVVLDRRARSRRDGVAD